MLVLAMALSLVVEVLVLSGDIGRMNTVFKVYLQIWLLMSVASGIALAWLWPHLRDWLSHLRFAWYAVLGLLVALSSLYPIIATNAKVSDRWTPDAPATLDGMAYMPYAVRHENGESFSLASDYAALQWLQNNIDGTPVILEANTVEYRWGSRVSIYTGLPSIVGWNWHQRQQRSAQPSTLVTSRVSDVSTLYNSTSIPLASDLLARYDVQYIIVGDLERAYYDEDGLSKFRQMADDGLLQIVYEEFGTVIYQVTT